MISLVQEALDDQRNSVIDCHTSGRSPKEIIVTLEKSQKSERIRV